MRNVKNFQFFVEDADETGLFTGYASVFNVVDQQNDIVLPGAFGECDHNKVKLLWQHDHSDPIGKVLVLKEDSRGLIIKARLLLDLQRGKEAHCLLRNGAICGLSIGYTVKSYSIDKSANNVRLLKAIDLWEISVVTFPANPEAIVTSVKALCSYNSCIAAVDHVINILTKK